MHTPTPSDMTLIQILAERTRLFLHSLTTSCHYHTLGKHMRNIESVQSLYEHIADVFSFSDTKTSYGSYSLPKILEPRFEGSQIDRSRQLKTEILPLLFAWLFVVHWWFKIKKSHYFTRSQDVSDVCSYIWTSSLGEAPDHSQQRPWNCLRKAGCKGWATATSLVGSKVQCWLNGIQRSTWIEKFITWYWPNKCISLDLHQSAKSLPRMMSCVASWYKSYLSVSNCAAGQLELFQCFSLDCWKVETLGNEIQTEILLDNNSSLLSSSPL